MEVEGWASSSGGMGDFEICVPDTNDEENYFTSGDIPKLQFRKNISRAHWDDEMGMAEVVGKKGSMWTIIEIVRSSKIYCSIEENLMKRKRKTFKAPCIMDKALRVRASPSLPCTIDGASSPYVSREKMTGRRWVIGVISQLEDDHFYLEDLTRIVEINLSNAISSTCLYFSLSRDLLSVLNAWIWAAL
ncbi:DNA polymerase epsilon subunit B [Camellia lanceoleosa]|nr:DNA polymerase epsilon subunit B [Camellia lanceoleosa]